jgi:hypothetical protein
MLPLEYRRLSSRAILIPSIVLAVVVLLLIGGFLLYSSYADRKYLAALNAQIAKLEPRAMRAAALDREFDRIRARVRLLDQYRSQTRNDLDALNEITRLLAPPIWTSNVDLRRDAVRLNGEGPQAAPLLKIFDSSRFFENTVIDAANPAPGGAGELFQIHANRRKR